MKTEIEKPSVVIARALKFASEAAEEEMWGEVKEICEQTLTELKELMPYWGKDSGEYPIIKDNDLGTAKNYS